MLLLFAILCNLGGKMNQIEVAPAVAGASPVIKHTHTSIYIFFIFCLFLFPTISATSEVEGGAEQNKWPKWLEKVAKMGAE